MRRQLPKTKTVAILALAIWLGPAAALASPEAEADVDVDVGAVSGGGLGTLIQEKSAGNDAAAASQERVDMLSDATDALAAEYRRAIQDTRALEVYNGQVEQLIEAQQREVESLRSQIDDVTVVGRQIVPLMLRMIDTLGKFVELDTPFLLDERHARVRQLREMMERADVTISEKYRRIIEAYQIENEYGRTIEAYRGKLDEDGGESRTVDFLRVGRVALLYQTLEGNESGLWSPESKQWAVLPDEYRGPVQQGLRMARKQVPPDLLKVPVSAPREAVQ